MRKFRKLFQKEMERIKEEPYTGKKGLERPEHLLGSEFNEFKTFFHNCLDLSTIEFPHLGIRIYYFSYLVDKKIFQDYLDKIRDLNKETLPSYLNQSGFRLLETAEDMENSVLDGSAILKVGNKTFELLVHDGETRAISPSETETVILGAHDAFVESVNVNLSLIRKRVKSSKLKAVKLTVGQKAKKAVYLLYIEGLVSETDIENVRKRVESVKREAIEDTNILVQYIDEHPNSPFPQFITTERPDLTVYKLFEGRIVGLMDNSPYAFCTPASFFDFMESMEDFGQRWVISTFIKAFRYIAVLVTLLFTALYVSVTTFHYEMIPQPLLPTLIESRSRVPFPPVIEALFLEFILELLREAGARLPTKVGQTIGIVGGIVIGQAAVDAGITSNILIIIVASSAISSFVVPNYLMSSTLRIIRFSFIILAGFLGNLGVVLGLGALIIHLSGLTSLNSPYLLPLSPTYPDFLKYTLLRGPFKRTAQKG